MNVFGPNPTTLLIPKWDSTTVGSLTYYDLEDNSTGGRSLDFWTDDLMTESIINWAVAGGVFDRTNTNLDDETPMTDDITDETMTQGQLDTIEAADPGATTQGDSAINM